MTLFDNRLPVAVYHTVYGMLAYVCDMGLIIANHNG
jgi:hypothetical protein